jgi:glycosyltransferase involved in cell wall biosynthesis
MEGLLMKYSIILPYYNRAGYLYNTLISYRHFYVDRHDFEVILAEDGKTVVDGVEHEKLLKVLKVFDKDIRIIHYQDYRTDTWNPSALFNRAIENSNGEFIILTSTECFHEVNILKGLDEEFAKDKSVYVVCACRNMVDCNLFISEFSHLGGKFDIWYQHSDEKYGRNRILHFCTSMSRKGWDKIGGFDEDFAEGIAHEDELFRFMVKRNFKIVTRDDLLVTHMDHSGFARPDSKDLTSELIKRNRMLVQQKIEDIKKKDND